MRSWPKAKLACAVPKSQELGQTLTALRSNCLKGKNDLSCPLKCNEISPQVDSQDHVLNCKKLSDGNNVNFTQIYDRIEDQQKILNLFYSSHEEKRKSF